MYSNNFKRLIKGCLIFFFLGKVTLQPSLLEAKSSYVEKHTVWQKILQKCKQCVLLFKRFEKAFVVSCLFLFFICLCLKCTNEKRNLKRVGLLKSLHDHYRRCQPKSTSNRFAYFGEEKEIKRAVLLLIINQKRCLMVLENQARPHWSLPGGGRKRGESCLRAAIREFKEETGNSFKLGCFQLESTFVEGDTRYFCGHYKGKLNDMRFFKTKEIKAVALPSIRNIEQVVRGRKKLRCGKHEAWIRGAHYRVLCHGF